MDSSGIAGVTFTKLNIISTSGGPVLHMLRSDSPLFSQFGEIYFSEVLPGAVKAWKRHKEMVQNFAVPVGLVKFVLYDNRPDSPSYGVLEEFVLGRPDRYGLLIIPPLVWYGFTCLSNEPGLIVNCASIVHRPDESEREPEDAGFIPYAWS